LPKVQPAFEAALPPSLKDRVTFQAHDFFTPQTVKDAQVYFLRHVLHDWPDAYAIKILQQLVPVLEKGNRVIVVESVMPPVGASPLPLQKTMTTLDLTVWGLLNAKERTQEDWKKLFKKADESFDVKAFKKPEGAASTVIEVTWKN
jgi:hypothetical protein